MKKVKIEKRDGKVIIYVGEVNQSGNYDILKLTEAEAAVLMMKLENAL